MSDCYRPLLVMPRSAEFAGTAAGCRSISRPATTLQAEGELVMLREVASCRSRNYLARASACGTAFVATSFASRIGIRSAVWHVQYLVCHSPHTQLTKRAGATNPEGAPMSSSRANLRSRLAEVAQQMQLSDGDAVGAEWLLHTQSHEVRAAYDLATPPLAHSTWCDKGSFDAVV
jgi:hypothetical protein